MTANGVAMDTWNTAGMAAGTYYIGACLYSSGMIAGPYFTQAITLAAATPSIKMTMPNGGTYEAGQSINFIWLVQNLASAGGTIRVYYDPDSTWNNGNEHWIQNETLSSSGYGEDTWDTTTVRAGHVPPRGRPLHRRAGDSRRVTQDDHDHGGLDARSARRRNPHRGPHGDPERAGAHRPRGHRAALPDLRQPSSSLAGIPVEITDLPGMELAATDGKTIYIDSNAAGYGWFIDPTPADNSEFTQLASGVLAAKSGTAAAKHVDLLTTVLHEMGHDLGLGHSLAPNDWMNALLPVGVRRLPSAND